MMSPSACWIDTHCHLDAPEFDADRAAVRAQARQLGVGCCVLAAVEPANWEAVRQSAHTLGDAYTLGIHPLYTPRVTQQDLARLEQELHERASDARLVAVGEIGLDFFDPRLDAPWQEQVLEQQLRMAQALALPVVLHVRRSVDRVLAQLRRLRFAHGGIAHAFNGSAQQAQTLIDLGFKLGFGGGATYPRALQLRRLARELPADALVMETDAPDIPPQWLYVPADARAQGQPQGRNSPAELPRIASELAHLRGLSPQAWMVQTWHNAQQALPRLRALLA